MQNQPPKFIFDEERASSYDQRSAKLQPFIEALHLLIRITLAELPVDAKILCVGAGTGSEILKLAQAFPGWHFTALEPAAPMLRVCRQRLEGAGFASRCTFHEGYVDSLPAREEFDGATCLLVSHFFDQEDARRNFFAQIAARLKPGGHLVSADLCAGSSLSDYENLLEVWMRMLRYAELPAEELEKFRASYNNGVAVSPAAKIESILGAAGFSSSVLIYQAGLIHAWHNRRA